MTYIMRHPVGTNDSLGQSWSGHTFERQVELVGNLDYYDWVMEYVNEKHQVLDAGCGVGPWLYHLARRGVVAVGLDVSETAVSEARKHNPWSDIYVTTIDRCDFSSAEFDVILCFGVVEHIESGVEKSLRELKRLLKPKGQIFISIPVTNISRMFLAHPLKTAKRGVRRLVGIKYRFEEYHYYPDYFQGLLIRAGFKVIESRLAEYVLPYNSGLCVDYPILRDRQDPEMLNMFGRTIAKTIPKWMWAGNMIWRCTK